MRRTNLRSLALTGLLLVTPQAVRTEPAAVEPRAAEILRAATSYVAKLERFAVDTDNAIEVVLESGQKLQFENPAKVTVRRPDRLRAERVGDLVDQAFFYDGKSLSLVDRGRGYYATVPAPPTIEGMLVFAQDSLDIVAPAADLLYRDAYEELTRDVSSGRYLGIAVVGGVRCHHLAFTAPDVDWQLWVQEGDQPLPRKYVITSKQVPGAPEFAVWMRRWDLAPKTEDAAFVFAPPEKARQIEFLQLTTAPGAGR